MLLKPSAGEGIDLSVYLFTSFKAGRPTHFPGIQRNRIQLLQFHVGFVEWNKDMPSFSIRVPQIILSLGQRELFSKLVSDLSIIITVK